MGVDRYFKRDDVGIVHQMNVAPGKQRGLIGATLLQAMFDRAAYGCRLFCCWCAQDLPANRFWESMGFVPLAYRAGSEKKRVKGAGVAGRVHIFWQKRIRASDTTTPWWFPAKTDGGAIGADRIVLPIPPGVHWSDEMPMILRPMEQVTEPTKKLLTGNPNKRSLPMDAPTKHGARQFDAPPAKPLSPPVAAKIKCEKAPKAKADPKLIAAARELPEPVARRWRKRSNPACR